MTNCQSSNFWHHIFWCLTYIFYWFKWITDNTNWDLKMCECLINRGCKEYFSALLNYTSLDWWITFSSQIKHLYLLKYLYIFYLEIIRLHRLTSNIKMSPHKCPQFSVVNTQKQRFEVSKKCQFLWYGAHILFAFSVCMYITLFSFAGMYDLSFLYIKN